MRTSSRLVSGIVGAAMLGAIPALGALASPAAAATTTQSVTGTATPATPATPVTSCGINRDGGWPGFTNGVPAGFSAGASAGDYIWHGTDGWRLRVTHAHDTHQVYTGVITTTGTFSDVTAVKLEGNDTYSVSPDGHTIIFRFNNYGGVDGLDFRTDCAPSIHFDLGADGHELDVAHVHIGAASTSPTSVPFVIQRSY